ncbi:uncharacterized protein PFL1_02921 [Pseudozyma flocculosa PF-1]|uniref:Zn(2)-C6 fungal-type domain-containing protein n=2 Tax=Pseudozyma flocculosa TaxID=84751 RepID=A0A5C3F3M7_9BASI|nr:uncharacterized protein PFL1_02921 [Pseudozyma flocculosa PF-1]EPQ29701.1 hypothetical protein PFL1_02921 [Pseudozyma flocculosa PF-1]SPO38277.1 uncharacterized protein PSFLO_03754 [Pseudozyma flocculosa]
MADTPPTAQLDTGLRLDQPTKPVQRRSALACLPCRSAKNKCDGQAPPLAVEYSASQALKAAPSDDIPSDAPCTRCRRLDLRCLWQPSHRTGRPRKKRRASETRDDFGSAGIGRAGLGAGAGAAGSSSSPHHRLGSHTTASGEALRPTLPPVDITGPEIFALLNTSPYDSTESSYSALDNEQYDESDPGLTDESASFDASSVQPSPPSGVAAWSATTAPATATMAPPSAGGLQLQSAFDADHPIVQERPSKRARDQFSMLRSRIGVGVRQERMLEINSSPPSLWPELPPEFLGHETDLQRGLRLYFSGFGLSVPILGEEENFFAARFVQMPELSPSPLVLHAAATLGLLLEEGKDAVSVDAMRARTRELADVTVERSSALHDTDLARLLSAIQGLILVAYDDYGRTQLPAAARYMRAACDLALRAHLNLLDSGRDFAAPHHGDPGQPGGHRRVSFAGIGSSRSFTQDFLQDCRRTWWELYIADLMFHMTTSGRLQRILTDRRMVVAVNSPRDPGDRERSEAYDIRIRAAALINECTRPPADPRNPDLGRLHAVDTMLSNLLLQGQSLWAGIAASVSNPSQQMRPTPMVQTKLEIIFTSLVVMHAARIHLHRQAWFSDLQMDLESCSFRPKHRSGTVEPTPSSAAGAGRLAVISDEARRDYIASSVSTIVSCSDGILRLIRLDAEMHLDLAMTRPSVFGAPPPPSSPVPPHWPFFACCSMVASFGYAVAVAASGPEHSALPSYRDEIRLRMGDGRGSAGQAGAVPPVVDYSIHGANDPTMDSLIAHWGQPQGHGHGQRLGDGCMGPASSPSQPSLSPSSSSPAPAPAPPSTSSAASQYELVQEQKRRDEEAYIWKTRAALSNISFAETTLSLYATIWPMAAVYQAEVRKCKGAVNLSSICGGGGGGGGHF